MFCYRIRNIEQHAADNVDKILVGNKCDMISEKVTKNNLKRRAYDSIYSRLSFKRTSRDGDLVRLSKQLEARV